MQVLFIVVAIVGTLFFIKRKAGFDYFTLAFFSCLIYFMPGFVGYVGITGLVSVSAIVPEAYGIMVFVMASIILFAWGTGFVRKKKLPRTILVEDPLFIKALFFLALFGLIMTIVTSGSALFSPNKHFVMANLDRWHTLFYSAATVGLPAAFMAKKYAYLAGFFALLLFDLYVGFRSSFAIAVISVLVVYFSAHGWRDLKKLKPKIVLPAVLAVVVLFGYKQIYIFIKYGYWSLIWNRVTDPHFFTAIFMRSEPFATQAILNSVVKSNFHVGFSYIYDVIYGFVPFAPALGANVASWHDVMQPALFPARIGGMAANIWAEMWSIGGWPLLIIFVLIFNLVLLLGNRTLRSDNYVIKAGLAPAFCYWAFYIHRNEVLYMAQLEKRMLVMFAVGVLFTVLVRAATGTRPARLNHGSDS
jgi:hypothetical protein